MIESNEVDDRNAENAEENPFPSGFGGIFSDIDDPSDIDSNTEEQSNIAKENATKQKQDHGNDEELSSIKGILSFKNQLKLIFKNHNTF